MADSDVEKIKDRLAINEVVGQYVQLKRAGRNYTAKCPFHKEKTASFYVSPERGTYICFGCGEKGDVFSFVQTMEGVDFPTALKQLAEKAGVKLTPRTGQQGTVPQDKEKSERLREVCEIAASFFEAQLVRRKDVQEYLRSRGVKDETKVAWRLGYAPASWEDLCKHLATQGFTKDEVIDAGFAVRSEKKQGEIFDRFRGRIMFPLFDAGGKVIAFSGRFFEKVAGARSEDEPAKYVNSPETALFKKSRVLYGLDKAKNSIRKADCILLVEGQFDVIMSHQSGLPFTVALSGTALTPEHLSLMSRLSKRLVLALDGDAAGMRSGLKSAAMALTAGFDVKVPAFPEGKDPADLARENSELLKAAVRTSKTAVEFFLEALRVGAKDERAYKKNVESQVLPLVASISSAIEREHFVRIVAARLGVSEGAVLMELSKRPVSQANPGEVAPVAIQTPTMNPFDKKVGMLLFHFGTDSDVATRLTELVGAERMEEVKESLAPQAEWLQFKFDNELGEHTTEATIAGDMLADIERQLERERVKKRFV